MQMDFFVGLMDVFTRKVWFNTPQLAAGSLIEKHGFKNARKSVTHSSN